MSTVPVGVICGPVAPADTNACFTGGARAIAFSTGTAAPVQLTLALTMGFHAGPLFIVNKRRAPVIHGGTLGGKRRRQRERKNTPKWAQQGEMKAKVRALYREAKRLTRETGEMHVVDHIVPLDGKIVCGLHWHVNMEVMHWLPNSKKGWGTWPDMPFEQMGLL